MLLYSCLPFTSSTLPFVSSRFPLLIPSIYSTTSTVQETNFSSTSNPPTFFQVYKSQELAKYRTSIAKTIIKNFTNSIYSDAMKPDATDLEKRTRMQWDGLQKQINEGKPVNFMNLLGMIGYFRHGNGSLAMVKSSDAAVWGKMIGFGLPILIKSRLLKWADYMLIDDILMKQSSSIETMTTFELIEALEERGFVDTLVDSNSSKLTLTMHLKTTTLIQEYSRRQGLMEDTSLDPKKQYLFNDIDTCSVVGLLVLARALNVVKAQ